jgi:hypothetical protein
MSNAEINALNKELADLQSQKKAYLSIYSDLETKIFLLNGAIDEILRQQAAFKIEDNARRAAASGCEDGGCDE